MARAYLGLGSNIDPESNLRFGMDALRRRYGDLDISPVYRSAAIGFTGEPFLNLVVGLDTDESPQEMHRQFEIIHGLVGRKRGVQRNMSRPLDIDLLMYDDLVLDLPKLRLPRSDILEYAFVLRPLAELAPSLDHPHTHKSMAEHWDAFDVDSQPLEPVDVIL